MAFPEKAFPKKLFPWNGFTIKDNSCTLYLVLHTPYVFFDKSFVKKFGGLSGKRFGGLSGKRFGGLSGKFFYRVYNEMKSCLVRSKSNLQWDEKSLYPEGILPLYPEKIRGSIPSGRISSRILPRIFSGRIPSQILPRIFSGKIPSRILPRIFSGY